MHVYMWKLTSMCIFLYVNNELSVWNLYLVVYTWYVNLVINIF